jgi:NADPH2:quinone reductase
MAAWCGSSPDLEASKSPASDARAPTLNLKVVKMTLVIAQYGQGGPEVMRAEERDVAAPGAAQVAIQQEAIGFNYFDVLQRRGLISEDEPGRVMGIEGAGVVTAISADVTDFAVGDRVGYLRSQGAYAGKRLIDADLLFPLPDDISFETAAALTVKGFTAWLCAVRLFEVQPGQAVLVTTAAGGVGSLTARLAAHHGARVIGAVGSEAKRALAHESGAGDVAVGLDDAIELVARLTDGNGVDVVFDGIGADTADRLLDTGTVRSGGTIISFGASGGWPKADPDAITRRGATVVVPQVPNYIKTPTELRADMSDVFALYLSGVFGEISPARYPLGEAVTLHAQVESRAASGISVLVP